jgi:hypothetical protein
LKIYRSANFRAHQLAKWAASYKIFESILISHPVVISFFLVPDAKCRVFFCSGRLYSHIRKTKTSNNKCHF